MVGGLLRVSLVVLLVYGGLLGLTYWEFTRAPTGFIPQQDKGYLLLNVQLPDSASVERTQRGHGPHRERWPARRPGVAHTVGISGQSLILNANAPNLGSMYVMLKEFDERRGRRLTADAIAAELRERCRKRGPRGRGLGLRRPADRRAGHDRRLQDDHRRPRQPRPRRAAAGQRPDRRRRATDTPGLQGLFNSSRANTPWLYLDIDRTKCMALGVSLSDVFNTLQVYLGSYYVNNFNEFGRTWQVNVRPTRASATRIADIRQLQVRNNQGQMIPLGTLLDDARHQRPGDGDALQHVLRRRRSPATRRRAPARARRSR